MRIGLYNTVQQGGVVGEEGVMAAGYHQEHGDETGETHLCLPWLTANVRDQLQETAH